MRAKPDPTHVDAPPAFAGTIGAARADITPPVGIYARSWGAAVHDVAEGIHRPLTATVLTLQVNPGSDPLVIASLDLGWWRTAADEWSVRGSVLESLGIDPARVMISFSHTHAGPSICREDADKPGGDGIGPYLDRLCDTLVRTTRKALEGARAAVLTWAEGRSPLARHRDLRDPEAPRLVCGYNPSGPAQDRLMVGRVTSNHGEVIATLVHYACHPVTLAWENRLISPDFVGAMRELVECATGEALCLFLQGASGELAPREHYTGDTDVADRNGRQLGYSVLAALEGMSPPGIALRYAGVVESGAPLAIWEQYSFEPSRILDARFRTIELPLKEMPSLADLRNQILECDDRVNGERLVRQRRVRETVGDGEVAQVPIWVWKVGDAILLGHPNEAYSALQTELQRRFPHIPVLVLNVVNGHAGYLPPAHLYDQDLYQVWQTPFARGCLERTTTECDSFIRQVVG